MTIVQRSIRIGVDAGGTNTDAVILDLSPGAPEVVLASTKTPTTPAVTDGIQKAVSKVLRDRQDIAPESIQAICIGTTHFVNALISKSEDLLERVAVIRLCGPYTRAAPPFASFPYDLRAIVEGPSFMVEGGLQINGSEISSVKEEEIEAICETLKTEGIRSVVICGVFSPIDFDIKQEEHVERIIKSKIPHILTTTSHSVANIGLLERENATILNASLLPFARSTVAGFRSAAEALGLQCPIFVTSNGGTLLTLEQAVALPIQTFSSGPTNSMRGASFLAQRADPGAERENALVVDVGGTTTEVGMLLSTGFPRQAASHHELCGVPLSFPMPHVTSVGLGGGSLVRIQDDGSVTIGPDSVGYRITEEALIFGGQTLTTTDVAVSRGLLSDTGDASKVQHLTTKVQDATTARIRVMMERAMDCMKTSNQPIPVYLVGGGAFLIPEDLDGISKVHRFPHYQCANAVGAAIAQISGEVDVVVELGDRSIHTVQQSINEIAIERAVAQGADAGTIEIIETVAIPVAYTAGRCRIYARAAGAWKGTDAGKKGSLIAKQEAEVELPRKVSGKREMGIDVEMDAKDILDYWPSVKDGVWSLSAIDLEWIATGTYILGCGGGGDPSHCYLAAREMLRAGHTIKVIELSSLQPQDLCGWGGYLGSPEVTSERLFGTEYEEATRGLLKFMGLEVSSLKGLIPLEIGGANGMINLLVAASCVFDLPLIDGDFMGRAYPTAWQTTPNVYDDPADKSNNLLPSCIASGDGCLMYMTQSKTSKLVDAALRAACTEMGTLIGYSAKPLTAEFCQEAMIKNSTSLSWRIGRAVMLATKQASIGNIDQILIDAVGGPAACKLLFAGKITSVTRQVYKGHTVGEVVITALSPDEEENRDDTTRHFEGTVTIPFKNENLYIEHRSGDNESKVLAAVPDLISILDAQNGKALGTPDYKYGLRVLILGIAAAPQWTSTKRGLELGDPSAFGRPEIPYRPLGEFVKPKSVIDEYNTTS